MSIHVLQLTLDFNNVQIGSGPKIIVVINFGNILIMMGKLVIGEHKSVVFVLVQHVGTS